MIPPIFQYYDDILDNKQVKSIHDVLITEEIDWHMIQSTVITYEPSVLIDPKVKEYIQFGHLARDSERALSQWIKVTDYVLDKFVEKTNIKIKTILRAKLNLLTRVESFPHDFYNIPHVNQNFPHYVLLYYVNDSDHPTRIFSGQTPPYEVLAEIEPKAGRYLLFNGEYYHAGGHPNAHDTRLLINYDFTINV